MFKILTKEKESVLITGSSRGIGKYLSEFYEKNGHQVTGISSKDVDLSNPDSLKYWLTHNSKLCPEILICNAGINVLGDIQKQNIVDVRKIFEVNFFSNVEIIKFFSKKMIEKKFGRIVVILSLYSQKYRKGRSAYSSSKSALEAFTKSCALEFGEFDILINSISPGFIETDLTFKNNSIDEIKKIEDRTALNRLGKVEELADLVYFLSSKKNSYITGQNILIDGGFSLT